MNTRMNTNIEVINPHLWAVKFSWLPWISELKLNLDPAYSSDEQVLAISDDGIIILNKDNPLYQLYRTHCPKYQKYKPKILKTLLADLESVAKRTNIQEDHRLMIQLELERRRKVGEHNGNHSKCNQNT